jgi:desulfoferrodoxin-like iron-binding protein
MFGFKSKSRKKTEERYKGDIYQCQKCGQEVIIIKVGKGDLNCCEKPMIKIEDEYDFEAEASEEAEE